MDRSAVEEVLEVSKSRFFVLLDEFSLTYQRTTPTRLLASAEKEIESELMLEKGLIDDPTLPITIYNYSAIKDRLAKRRVKVFLPTIIN